MTVALLLAAVLPPQPPVTLEIIDVVNIEGPAVWVDLSFDVPNAHNFGVETENSDGVDCESGGVLVRPNVKAGDRALVRAAEGRVQWRPLSCYTGEWLVEDEVLEVVEGVSVEDLNRDKVWIIYDYVDPSGRAWFVCRETAVRTGYRKYACEVEGVTGAPIP